MMPPSNQVESNAEDSSSSGGSVVQSMNLLSTAKGSSSNSSGDSRDASDMSGKHETSEVSEESDPESAKDATEDSGQKSALDLSKEKAPEMVAATRKEELNEKTAPTKEELVPGVASASVPPAHDSDQSVEALALIAVEAAAKHAPAVQAGTQVSSFLNATGTQLHPPAENPSVATSSQSVQPSDSANSDQSVQYTVDSSISGASSRSNEAPFPPTSGFQTIGAAAAAAVAAAVEPQIPVGQIHLKQVRLLYVLSVVLSRSFNTKSLTPILIMIRYRESRCLFPSSTRLQSLPCRRLP